jgi:hypothetical protein
MAKVNLPANDMVAGIGTLTYGGTLVVSNVGVAPLTNGASLKLFDASSYTGSFANISPAQPGPSLFWDTSGLTVNGTLKVVAAAFQGLTLLPDGNFRLTLTGPVGQAYTLRASTNVALPFANWTVLGSGTIPSSPFTFDDLTATNYRARFYRMSLP